MLHSSTTAAASASAGASGASPVVVPDATAAKHPEGLVLSDGDELPTAVATPPPPPPQGADPDARQFPIRAEYPGMPALRPARDLPLPKTRVTTLANGLRVASEETYGQVSSIAVFVDSGSKHESADESGVSHFLETLAFKSTTNRSAEQIREETQGMGVFAAASRDSMMYRVEVLRGQLGQAVDFLADTLMNPLLSDEQVDEARGVIEYQLMDVAESPHTLIQENMHTAAFGNATLGKPLICPQHRVQLTTADTVKNFMRKMYVAPRMVLAAAGVDHDEFVKYAEATFGDLPSESPAGSVILDEPVVYVGGDSRSVLQPPPPIPGQIPAAPEYTHVAVCFPSVGWKDPDVVPVCVLDMLLGGGSSFSAGGPGKGMYSRLYLQVLNKYGWVESASAFSVQFNDSGLSGIFGSATPGNAGQLLNVICSHLRQTADSLCTEVELARARNQLRSAVMLNLERRGVLCEDIGRQILCMGEREDPAHLCDRIEAVTREDLQRVAARALESRPTVSVVGPDISAVASYDVVEGVFGGQRREGRV